MKARVALAIAALVAVGIGFFGPPFENPHKDRVDPVDTREPVVIQEDGHVPLVTQEDDPRWDCSTMGNRVCGGPQPVVANPTLVG